MTLEIKTTTRIKKENILLRERHNDFPTESTKSEFNNNRFKKWVSVESLKDWIQNMDNMGHDEGIIKALRKDVSGNLDTKWQDVSGEEHTFMWAVEQMNPKDIIQREHWKKFNGTFGLEWNACDLCLRFTNNRDGIDRLTKHDVMANDWSIVRYKEPKKTLWDNLQLQKNIHNPMTRFLKDKYLRMSQARLIEEIRTEHDTGMNRAELSFKEALKEFVESIRSVYEIHKEETFILDKAKEIFGSELIEDNSQTKCKELIEDE